MSRRSVASFVRRYGRNAVRLPIRRVAATVGLGLRKPLTLSERHTGERHRQRQHQRRDQQRNALFHLLTTFPLVGIYRSLRAQGYLPSRLRASRMPICGGWACLYRSVISQNKRPAPCPCDFFES
jgi:hypothetical protein